MFILNCIRGHVSMKKEKSQNTSSNKKTQKKKSPNKKFFIITACICFIVFLGSFFAFRYVLGGLSIRQIDDSAENLGLDADTAQKSKDSDITNIALFGIDTRDPDGTSGRSDSIIILSVDQKNNVVKMTSILRDSKVPIDGHGEEKITHAYMYGGPELAIKTINENFHLDIKDYVTVNFSQLADVIDVLGGIDIEITEEERQQINISANAEGLSAPEVTESGMVHLNGAQATAYARIRHIDSDIVRADRQKKVLECMLSKVQSMSVFEYPSLLSTILPMVETSLGYTEIFAFSPMLLGDITIEETSVPNSEDNAVGGGNPWVWEYDLEKASERMHEFIYG